eukprot:12532417-Ditylum_brightwellii.AAC.1
MPHKTTWKQLATPTWSQERVYKIWIPTTKTSAPTNTPTLTPVKVELLVHTTIWQEETIQEESDIKETIGKYNGLMWSRTYATQHPAASLLQNYAAQGCPVDYRPDWSHHQIPTALKHGPHKLTRTPYACKTLHAETDEKIQNGFAQKVCFGNIKNNLPPKLKISPVVCIPHKSKSY